MPAEAFSVRPDRDELARRDIAAALARPVSSGADSGQGGAVEVAHHGARDERLAARQRSERARSGRAAGAGGGRSYAFRRS
ncbi:hypothetical protein [Actinoplanes palleronii]|uniref:hypothetical protein n=1 Tax=Actinoplanes palleronii TaxID=113570 RepID=UPI0019441F28|nr:hypothetical protein [Actinoplanes palleronii]